ncbi:MAG: hypothetical protein K2X87_09370 [Gemmataceae bacterium]|nr:hypothetical protein [Gemmataceae bacterium]
MDQQHTPPTDPADDGPTPEDLRDGATAITHLVLSFMDARETGNWCVLSAAVMEVIRANAGEAGDLVPLLDAAHAQLGSPRPATPPTGAVDYKTDLIARLKDLAYAKEYLAAVVDEAAADQGWNILALAAKDVIEAHTGVRELKLEDLLAGITPDNLHPEVEL